MKNKQTLRIIGYSGLGLSISIFLVVVFIVLNLFSGHTTEDGQAEGLMLTFIVLPIVLVGFASFVVGLVCLILGLKKDKEVPVIQNNELDDIFDNK